MTNSSTDMQIFILLGPPGAGKGTQAKNLCRYFHLPHISTGDLLREQIHKKTELGKKVEVYMQSGQLVPDDTILHILFERISALDCRKGYILDGFPRTLAQAEKLQTHFKQCKVVPFVFNLCLSDQEIIERLSNRLVCTKCHTPYHLFNSPPKQAGICDVCHTSLTRRPDDEPEVVKNRLAVYHQQTSPLTAYYKKLKLLHAIDCSQTEKQIFTQMLFCLHASLDKETF